MIKTDDIKTELDKNWYFLKITFIFLIGLISFFFPEVKIKCEVSDYREYIDYFFYRIKIANNTSHEEFYDIRSIRDNLFSLALPFALLFLIWVFIALFIGNIIKSSIKKI